MACRHNLYLNDKSNGAVHFPWPDREPWDMDESCALDVADRGEHTLEEVGDLYGITRESVRLVEARAILKLKVLGQ